MFTNWFVETNKRCIYDFKCQPYKKENSKMYYYVIHYYVKSGFCSALKSLVQCLFICLSVVIVVIFPGQYAHLYGGPNQKNWIASPKSAEGSNNITAYSASLYNLDGYASLSETTTHQYSFPNKR